MNAETIARALGAARRSNRGWSCRCPAHNDRNPSLSVQDGERGLLVKCWTGCDPRDVLAELRRRGLLGGSTGVDARPALAKPCSDNRDDVARRFAAARSIWNSAKEAQASPVTAYLAGRGIDLPVPPTLRWAPSLRRPDGTRVPAMVARIDGLDGELIGITRTWLDRGPDGIWRRRDRAMLGPTAGGAVRLADAGETLVVAEGIETAASVMLATGFPAWAALSAGGIAALVLPPLPLASLVIVAANHDRNGVGERAARIPADGRRGSARYGFRRRTAGRDRGRDR
jgi:putative DNA primase/helicase